MFLQIVTVIAFCLLTKLWCRHSTVMEATEPVDLLLLPGTSLSFTVLLRNSCMSIWLKGVACLLLQYILWFTGFVRCFLTPLSWWRKFGLGLGRVGVWPKGRSSWTWWRVSYASKCGTFLFLFPSCILKCLEFCVGLDRLSLVGCFWNLKWLFARKQCWSYFLNNIVFLCHAPHLPILSLIRMLCWSQKIRCQ